MALLAGIASVGMAVRIDPTADLLMPFVAALLWGAVGLSAFDVVVDATFGDVVTRPITPLAWLGIGFALLATLFGIYQLISKPAEELEQSDMSFGGGR